MSGYRPDIDGLRAAAVTAVVLYHAGVTVIGGGFVGVDVFFVISGFLITRIIQQDLDAGRFSFRRFYARRARRILPALLAMIAVTLAVGAVVLLPHERDALGRSAAAALLSGSNVWFWLTLDGYFAAAADTQPLLHTWSLAIEEQFYLLLPVLLILAARLGGSAAFWAVAAVSALSFALSVWLTPRMPQAAFYLLPTRACELGGGALIALAPRLGAAADPARLLRWRPLRELVAAAGAGLIALAMFAFDEGTSFPGVAAAIPSLGAGLVIAAGCAGATAVSRLLSLRPVVFVGLISYSLYLWHWPIIVYARLLFVDMEAPAVVAALVAASAVAATLSWRWIETPFRHGPLVGPWRPAAVAVPVLVVVGLIAVQPGLRGGATLPDAARAALAQARSGPASACYNAVSVEDARRGAFCRGGADGAPARFALVGDSHADALAPALDRAARAAGLGFTAVVGSWCAPLDDFASPLHPDYDCRGVMSAALDALARDPGVDTVVLAAQWANYTEGRRWDSAPVAYLDAQSTGYAVEANPEVFARALRRTVAALRQAGKRVVVLTSTPELDYSAPEQVARRVMLGLDPAGATGPDLAAYAARNGRVEAALAALPPGAVRRVEGRAAFCDGPASPCRIFDGAGRLLYADSNHLADAGAALLAGPVLAAVGREAGVALAAITPEAGAPDRR